MADSAPDQADDAQDAGPYAPPSKLVCPGACESHTTTAPAGGSELKEASGIVASLRDDGVLWLHNDSGDMARLFVVSQGGAMLGRFNAGQGVADLGQVASTQAALGPFDEIQGEAVAYDATGEGLWTISEAATLGFAQPLHHYDCSAPGDAP